MANFIAIHVLKNYNPGTFNRGENGEAKQIIMGGITRARFSSQCLKRPIREMMACPEIRTAHVEKLISNCLDTYVSAGTITEKQKDLVGKLICSPAIIGADCWGKLGKTKKTKDDDTLKESADESEGNRIIVTNASEITALVEGFVNYLKEHSEDELQKNYKDVVKNALVDVGISVSKSMFGAMATDGVLGTVDGAVEMGQSFSLDPYLPEPDYFAAKYSGIHGATEADPFYDVYNEFTRVESAKRNAETVNTGLSLYSNLMYSYANVNVNELERNLNSFIYPRRYVPNKDNLEILKDETAKFVQAMIEVVPEATQNRSSSHILPCAVLIEVIKDGSNLQPDWTTVIRPTENKSTSEQAIEKLGKFANDKTFRSGEIKQYVMLGTDFEDFAKNFKDAKQLHNFAELEKAIKKDLDDILENITE